MAAAFAAASGLCGSHAFADSSYPSWLADIDYPKLFNEYTAPGKTLANGAGVPVTIVESGGHPDTTVGQFAGKTFTNRVFSNTVTSHATDVGAYFFGAPGFGIFTQRGVATGVTTIDMYDTGWYGAFFLNQGSPEPLTSPNGSRVASHSYFGNATFGFSTQDQARQDFIVERDDFIQVVYSVSSKNNFVEGEGAGYNSIAVGRTDGDNGAKGTVASSSGNTVYTAGRYKPDLSGPQGTASNSIGVVSGMAAQLVSLSYSKPSLSNYSYLTPRLTGNLQYTVHSADTSEVIKAALMAGAMRETSGKSAIGNISDYRTAARPITPGSPTTLDARTNNGLDTQWGAGLANVYNSYKIIDAGEHDSLEDGNVLPVGQYGFDYDPSFGGASGSNSTATYTFSPSLLKRKLFATLAWNAKVIGNAPPNNIFDGTVSLNNLDLKLIDVTQGNSVAAWSKSLIDNTENIWIDLNAGDTYHLQVVSGGGSAFNWDYGIAWRTEDLPEPSAVLFGAVSCAGTLLLRRRR